MIYRWFEKSQTCEELGQELGCQVKSITRGNIIAGYEDTLDGAGKPIQIPIMRNGIEIEADGAIDAARLQKLDRKFQGLEREGSQDLATELEEMKARLNALENITAIQ